MRPEDEHICILVAGLVKALEKAPDGKIEIDLDHWAMEDMRRDFPLKILTQQKPDGGKRIRIMKRPDYEKWCLENSKPKGRKLYLD